jgi:host factor-I protein
MICGNPKQQRGSVAITIESMATKKRHKGAPSGETGQEALYLKSLSDRQVQVAIKLRDGEVVSGWIEYFDDMMLRLTREGKPNLFIYKAQIRTITEAAAAAARRAKGNREQSAAG